MKKYRHAGIDTFYSPETHKQTAYLSFGNTDSPKSYNYSNHYNYRLPEAISLEDLIEIESSEYGSVTIIDNDDAYGTEYSLSEWLRKKGD